MRHALIPLLLSLAVPVHAADAPQARPYAGEQHRAIKALSAREVADLRAGRGMGLAKAAELNGYPGPMHVLEHADALALDAAQRAATQAVFDAMRAQAQALGAQQVEAEARLEALFATRAADAAAIDAATARIGQLQAALRAVHLRAHVAQDALMTPAQRARYAALRGYDGASHGDDDAHAGHAGH